MSWNLVELLSCRASAINHFPSWFVMSFLSLWKVAFLIRIWNLCHIATSFPSCFFQEFPSTTWMPIVLVFTTLVPVALHALIQILFKKSKHNIKSHRTLLDGSSSWHLLVDISILHSCWHISQRYPLLRVSIFFRVSSESSYPSKGFPSQIFLVYWMLIGFIRVAYLTVSSFLTHSIPGAFNQSFLTVVNHLILHMRTYYVDFILVWLYAFLHPFRGDPFSLDHVSQDRSNDLCYLQPYDMTL